MKRWTLLLAIFSLLTLVPANAQHYVGVIGGLHLADMRLNEFDPGIDEIELKNRSLWGAGAAIGLQLNRNLFLHFEPMFLQKGSMVVDSDIDDPDFDVAMDFIEIPAMLKFEFGNTAVKPFFMGGASIGFLLNSEVELESGGLTFKGDIKDLTKNTNFGLVFGGGFSIAAGKATILLEGLYNHGLTNLNKGGEFELRSGDIVTDGGEIDSRDEFFTKGIQIQAGIVFPLGG